jgi:hypothetical protein
MNSGTLVGILLLISFIKIQHQDPQFNILNAHDITLSHTVCFTDLDQGREILS